MTFAAPLDPSRWTLSAPGPVTVAPGLRYAGLRLLALQATTLGGAEAVLAPAPGVVRSVLDGGGPVVELQVNPFLERRVVQALPFGSPVFIFLFDVGATTVALNDGDTVQGGDLLATVEAVTILCVGQDRTARDPGLWSRLIAEAGAPDDPWVAFANEVEVATVGADPPVLLLDHTGALLQEGEVEITAGATTTTVSVLPIDGGDLQRTVARLNLTSLFSAAASVQVSPVGGDPQLASVDDKGETFAERVIDATPQRRHLTFTDLEAWFAPQFSAPVGGSPLPRFSRGNQFTPFVNGPPYFDDLMRRLRVAAEAAAAGQGGGLHLVGGWETFPEDRLTDLPDVPRTLLEAATLLDQNGGASRFLSPQFFQLDQGSVLETAEIIVMATLMGGLLFNAEVDFLRSDGTGAAILVALMAANAIAVTWIISTDGRALEPNKDMLEVFESLPSVESRFGPHPATVEDNPASPPLSGFPFDSLLQVGRRFGFYHQKFGVVAVGDQRFAYCGGIDINPNRLDDDRHLEQVPYHDVHARIRGLAARDVEVSFEQRWSRDGGGTALAFDPDGDYGTPGTDAVQVARTYFRAADPSRRLDYAPNGDRTILDTMLRAIGNAREFIYIEDQYLTPPDQYREALVDKVASGDIGALVIVLPSSPDQPFGEIQRSGLVDELRFADGGRGIVRVGYPRRHYTVAENDLRASSGRLVLMADLPAAPGLDPTILLGPGDRVPLPPFWVAVGGEMMYVYNESTTPLPDPPEPEDPQSPGDPDAGGNGPTVPDASQARIFEVLRGGDTRLLRGGPPTTTSGPRVRAHEAGAAATVVNLSGIYVHAKMMIVDDVFVGIGSANLNRRGLCHDGEITAFSVPQQLRSSPSNPVAALRRQLWAEMLDLPLATIAPLLDDPIAAARLFDRSPLLGNRFTDIDALPTKLMWDATGGDGLVLNVLRALLVDPFIVLDHQAIFDAVVDPTSAVETS